MCLDCHSGSGPAEGELCLTEERESAGAGIRRCDHQLAGESSQQKRNTKWLPWAFCVVWGRPEKGSFCWRIYMLIVTGGPSDFSGNKARSSLLSNDSATR